MPRTLRRFRCRRRALRTCGAVSALLSVAMGTSVGAQTGAESLDAAIAAFADGRIEDSLIGFDRAVQLDPDSMPYLWQRGIALYYAERWADCRTQFEVHRNVNPNDVENAAWHFLCVARQESPARARELILPVGPDARSPMTSVYLLYRGDIAPEAVLAAAGNDLSAQFYAHLYLGLYAEALGRATTAIEHLRIAASDRYASRGNYMHMVARVHVTLRDAR